MTRFWADDLLEAVRRNLQGRHQGRNRVIVDERTFISIRLNGELVEVQVGDLDSSPVDFQALEFHSARTSIAEATRALEHAIRRIQMQD